MSYPTIVEFWDKSVVVEPIEEIGHVFCTQSMHNNLFIAEQVRILAGIDEAIQKYRIRRELIPAMSVALLIRYKISEQTFWIPSDFYRRDFKHPFVELDVQNIIRSSLLEYDSGL